MSARPRTVTFAIDERHNEQCLVTSRGAYTVSMRTGGGITELVTVTTLHRHRAHEFMSSEERFEGEKGGLHPFMERVCAKAADRVVERRSDPMYEDWEIVTSTSGGGTFTFCINYPKRPRYHLENRNGRQKRRRRERKTYNVQREPLHRS